MYISPLVAISCTASGVSFPSALADTGSFEPFEKKLRRPHSSVSTWEDSEQITT